MIRVAQSVNRLTGYHRWFSGKIDAELISAIARSSLSQGMGGSPARPISKILALADQRFKSMVKEIINEVGSDAIVRAMDQELFFLSESEASRIEQLVSAYEQHLYAIISSQLFSDSQQAINNYHELWLNVELAQYREGIDTKQALMLERERMLSKTSVRLDRTGRRWDSNRYVEVESKRAITNLYNVIFIYLSGKRGAEKLAVYNPGHKNDGKVFAFDDYQTVESTYFHPNSLAVVDKVIY